MSIARVLKKVAKIIGITLLVVVLLLTGILVVAKYNENRIAHYALGKVSEMIQAPVECDSLSLLLLRRFPYATVEFNGFKLGPTTDTANWPRQQLFDTLLSFDRVFVSLKTMPALRSKFEIQAVELSGLNLNYSVDTAGVSNFDFLLSPDTAAIDDTTRLILNVLLQNLTLTNVALAYKDDRLPAMAHALIPRLHLEGRIDDQYYAGLLSGNIVLHRCAFSDYHVELMERTNIDFDVNYDDGHAHINALNIASDGLDLAINGEANIADTIFFDIHSNIKNLDIKEVSKYAPEKLLRQFGVGEVAGTVQSTAHVRGYFRDSLFDPSLKAQVNMRQCKVELDSLPALEHLDLISSIDAPNLFDLSTIKADITKLDLRSSRSRVKVQGWIRNLMQPNYSVNADLHLSLDEANLFVPKEVMQHVGGDVHTTLSTSGSLPNDITSPSSIDYFLDRTSLTLNLDRVSAALDDTLQVRDLSLDFVYKPNRTFSLSKLQADAPTFGVSLGKSLLSGSVLGRVADMDNMGARLDTFYLQAGGANIGGRAFVKGLKRPRYRINTTANVAFDDMIRSFIPDSLLDHIDGRISLGLRSHGQVNLDTIDINKLLPIVFEQSKMKLAVRDLNFGLFEDTLVRLSNLQLDMAMANDTLRIDNLHGIAHGVDFWVDSMEVWNIYRAYLQRKPGATLIAQTGIRLGDIDYATFAHLVPTDSTAQADSTVAAPQQAPTQSQPVAKAETSANTQSATVAEQTVSSPAAEVQTANATAEPPAFVLPEGLPPYIVRGSVAVNSVRYEKNYIDSISLKFRVDDSLYVVDDLVLRSFGGTMKTSAVCDMRTVDTLNIIEIQNEIKHLDLGQVLRDNDDFGKSELISHKSIGGQLTSKINAQIRLKDFDINTIVSDKIMVLGTFELANGKLHNFEPIIEVGKLIMRKDLENIDFDTLRTNLFMFKNKAYIPKTDIVTSAMDLTAYGMQSFIWPQGMGEEYEYHAVVHLGDVLLGKSKKQKKEAERKGISVVAMNNEGVKRTFFDNDDLKRKMRIRLRLQHSILATLYHPKLVNFSTEFDRIKHKKEATVVNLAED